MGIYHGINIAREKLRGLAVLAIIIACGAGGCVNEEPLVTEKSTSKPISQVLEDAEFAITERNFRINNRLHIGKAINERGPGGFPDNEVILFCNLSHAQKMLELAPEYIAYCPHRVAVRDAGDKRIITASLLPQGTSNTKLNTITSEVNALVREIIEFAAEEWPELERETSD